MVRAGLNRLIDPASAEHGLVTDLESIVLCELSALLEGVPICGPHSVSTHRQAGTPTDKLSHPVSVSS